MNNKFAITVVLSTLLLIGAGVWLGSTMQKPEVAMSGESQADVPETVHDWGTIPLTGGEVTKSFPITNSGTQTLQLHDISTSCMCTTAQLTINDQTSPQFGMHQKSAWVGKIEPGQTAQLIVVFDPAFHGPSGVGSITRQITAQTNDPNHPTLNFNLTAQVIN